MNSTLVDARLAGQVIHYGSAPKDFRMRIPDQAIRCVGFIKHDAPNAKYIGTVFVVAVDSEMGDGGYLHLVTAKHVADLIDPGPFVIGMNGKNGRKVFLKSSDEWTWWHHPKTPEAVDVAVMPFATANLSEINVEWIPEKMFVMPQRIRRLGIGIGDELACVGLFTEFHGSSELVPIVRSGIISMLPRDPIPTKDFSPMEAVLIESRSIGGLSGSPVFVRNAVSLPPVKDAEGDITSLSGLGSLHFLGLIHGHWNAGDSAAFIPEEAHSGLSIVVPASKIAEVLHHPELIEMRRKIDQKANKTRLPVADSAQEQKEFTQQDFEAALKKASRKIESPKS
jgi:hypothetical protein